MKQGPGWVVGFTLALVWLCTAFSGRAQSLPAKMNQYMQASMKVDRFMGPVLVAEHGKVLFSKGYEMANLKLHIPDTPETEFRIGSITTEFMAISILELQARGKLNVQDPICKYVPDCPADWNSIKIFNLLTHTSGIPNFTSFPNYLDVASHPITATGLLALFETKPLNFKPR